MLVRRAFPAALAAVLLLTALASAQQLGVDVYPDRPVSRPLEYRLPVLESTAVNLAGSGVIQRAADFHHISGTSLEKDGLFWLHWRFNVKPGQADQAALVFNENAQKLRVPHRGISFTVRNLGDRPVAFRGEFAEVAWSPDPAARFHRWRTAPTAEVAPGETRELMLDLDRLIPASRSPKAGRVPRFPMNWKLVVEGCEEGRDYDLALRQLTFHTAFSPLARASTSAVATEKNADGGVRANYRSTFAPGAVKKGWHKAYLELRRGAQVLRRTDVTDALAGVVRHEIAVTTELPLFLPTDQYELGLAIDGLRVEGSEVAVQAGSQRRPGFPRVELRPFNGRPTVFINGEPFIWTGYSSYEWQPGQLEDFAEAGVNLFAVPVNAGRHLHQITPPLLAEPGRLDFGPVEEAILLSLSANPEARVLLRVSLALPPHELHRMPDEIVKVRTAAGDLAWEETATLVASFSSEKWRQRQTEVLASLLEFVGSRPYADRVIGVCLTSGGTEEWFGFGANNNAGLGDYSAANEAAFAAWSEERGFPFRRVPEPAGRGFGYAAYDIFPGTPTGRSAAAYGAFMSSASVEALRHFCREAKNLTGGKLLAGTMYAYLVQLAGEPRQHAAHSMNMAELLADPAFDFFMGIPFKNFRTLEEGVDTFVTAVSSVQLHDKVYINENDLLSWLHNWLWYQPYDPRDPRAGAVTMHQRVTASDVVYGNESQWFGLGAHWHYDPAGGLLQAFRRLNDIKISSVGFDREPCEEIAFLLDDTSFHWTTPGTKLTGHQIPQALYALVRTGAPVGLYLLSDLDRLPDRIKLAVIPWAPAMSPSTRAKLATALRSPRRDYYLSGPVGLVDTSPERWAWDEEGMRSLTGLPLAVEDKDASGLTKPDAFKTAQMRISLPDGYTLAYKPDVRMNPGLRWNAADAAGHHLRDKHGLFGLREENGRHVYWSAVSVNDEDFLRHLAARAGVHFYAPRDFGVHAARGVVAVTAPRQTAAAEICFPRAVAARDLFTDQRASGQKQVWDFSPGQTRLFLLDR
jgi:hypothetical protein